MSHDLFDHFRLREIQRSVDQIRKATSTANPFAAKQADVITLQQEVGELRLLVAVLYRLLLSKGHFSEGEINTLIASLDAADGRRDGQFQGDAVLGTPKVEPVEENGMPKIRVS